MKKLVKCPPLPRMAKSLQNTDHDPYTATADIIDNSIDADATTIKLDVCVENKEFVVRIIDDGFGMDVDGLLAAMTYGDHRSGDGGHGKFGLGLKTSATSIGNRFEVHTRDEDGKILRGSFDVDELIAEEDPDHQWEHEISDEIGDEDVLWFNECVGTGTGTIVTITKIDRTNASQFATRMKQHLGQVYRNYLAPSKDATIPGKIKMYVNNALIYAVDPLLRHIPSTKPYEIPIELAPGEVVHATIVKLGKLEAESDKVVDENDDDYQNNLNTNIRNQGVYVMRNDREIMSADKKVFAFTWPGKGHNSMNYIRVELAYSSELDKHFQLNHNKTAIQIPSQSIRDKIKSALVNPIKEIKRQIDEEKAAVPDGKMQEIFDAINATLIEKRRTLILPKGKSETRQPSGGTNNSGSIQPKNSGGKRGVGSNPNLNRKEIVPTIGVVSNGKGGAIFEYGLNLDDGKPDQMYVNWNTDHPFYQKFVINHAPDQLIATTYLIIGLATAFQMEQGNCCSDENDKLVDNLMERISTAISQNMRTLS